MLDCVPNSYHLFHFCPNLVRLPHFAQLVGCLSPSLCPKKKIFVWLVHRFGWHDQAPKQQFGGNHTRLISCLRDQGHRHELKSWWVQQAWSTRPRGSVFNVLQTWQSDFKPGESHWERKVGNKDVKESEERMALTQEGLGADLLATPASLIHCIRKNFSISLLSWQLQTNSWVVESSIIAKHLRARLWSEDLFLGCACTCVNVGHA